MIRGSQARTRPMVQLLERSLGIDLTDPPRPDPRDHRDRGHFLSPRLYPTAPFEPWQPASTYAQPPADPDAALVS